MLVNYQSLLSNIFPLAPPPPPLFFFIKYRRNRLLRVSFIVKFYDLPVCKQENCNVFICHFPHSPLLQLVESCCAANFYTTFLKHYFLLKYRGGVEARGQGHKKIEGQRQPFRGQTLFRPRTGMLEAKDTSASALQKKKVSKNFFSGDLKIKKKSKKVFTKIFQVISKKKKFFTKIFQAISRKTRLPKHFSAAPQNLNNSKNSAVL